MVDIMKAGLSQEDTPSRLKLIVGINQIAQSGIRPPTFLYTT